MTDLAKRIADRYDRRYGKLDPMRLLAKLLEETGELSRAIIRNDMENAHEELGDVVIVLESIARYLQIDIETAVRNKLEVHEERLKKWESKNPKPS
jgi:NTP pyrophosphatase (non-canonical NTP hydrolase)